MNKNLKTMLFALMLLVSFRGMSSSASRENGAKLTLYKLCAKSAPAFLKAISRDQNLINEKTAMGNSLLYVVTNTKGSEKIKYVLSSPSLDIDASGDASNLLDKIIEKIKRSTSQKIVNRLYKSIDSLILDGRFRYTKTPENDRHDKKIFLARPKLDECEKRLLNAAGRTTKKEFFEEIRNYKQKHHGEIKPDFYKLRNLNGNNILEVLIYSGKYERLKGFFKEVPYDVFGSQEQILNIISKTREETRNVYMGRRLDRMAQIFNDHVRSIDAAKAKAAGAAAAGKEKEANLKEAAVEALLSLGAPSNVPCANRINVVQLDQKRLGHKAKANLQVPEAPHAFVPGTQGISNTLPASLIQPLSSLTKKPYQRGQKRTLADRLKSHNKPGREEPLKKNSRRGRKINEGPNTAESQVIDERVKYVLDLQQRELPRLGLERLEITKYMVNPQRASGFYEEAGSDDDEIQAFLTEEALTRALEKANPSAENDE
jgi:hypothetical protein